MYDCTRIMKRNSVPEVEPKVSINFRVPPVHRPVPVNYAGPFEKNFGWSESGGKHNENHHWLAV